MDTADSDPTTEFSYESVRTHSKACENMYYRLIKRYKEHLVICLTAGQARKQLYQDDKRSSEVCLRKRLPRFAAGDNFPIEVEPAVGSPGWLPADISDKRARIQRSTITSAESKTALHLCKDRRQGLQAKRVAFPAHVQKRIPPPMQSWANITSNAPGQECTSLWHLPYVDDETDLRAELVKAEYQLMIRVDRRRMLAQRTHHESRLFSAVCTLLQHGFNSIVAAYITKYYSDSDADAASQVLISSLATADSCSIVDGDVDAINSSLSTLFANLLIEYPQCEPMAECTHLSKFIGEVLGMSSGALCAPLTQRIGVFVPSDLRNWLRDIDTATNTHTKHVIIAETADAAHISTPPTDLTMPGETADTAELALTEAPFLPPTVPVCRETLPFQSLFCRYCFTYGCALHGCPTLSDPQSIARHHEVNQLPEMICREARVSCPISRPLARDNNIMRFSRKRQRTATGTCVGTEECAGVENASMDTEVTSPSDEDTDPERVQGQKQLPPRSRTAIDVEGDDIEKIYFHVMKRLSLEHTVHSYPPSLEVSVSPAHLQQLFLRVGGQCCLLARLLFTSCAALADLTQTLAAAAMAAHPVNVCRSGVTVLFPTDWWGRWGQICDHADALSRVATKKRKPGFYLSLQGRMQMRLIAEMKLLPLSSNSKGPPIKPCFHEGSCKANPSCTCNENSHMCTKYCGCASTCEMRWWGCCCKSGCKRQSCPCLVADRECDPDLCGDCHCGEALRLAYAPSSDDLLGPCDNKSKQCTWYHLLPESVTTEQRCAWLAQQRDPAVSRAARSEFLALPFYCANAQLQCGRKKRTRLALSTIVAAGCGLFVGEPSEAGDLIREYQGECISTTEADRRGVLYDMMNISYLFDIDDMTTVDATRLGNKIRFANHADAPNCLCIVKVASGQRRIGIYAARPLRPHEELFFDYGYRTKVAWQQDPTLARKPRVEAESRRRVH